MQTRSIAIMLALAILLPHGALAYQRDGRKPAPAPEATTPPPEEAPARAPQRGTEREDAGQMEKGAQPVHRPHPMTEEEYERKVKSAQALITAGFIMAIAGGAAAVAGSAYAIAKPSDRLVGGIIGIGGLAFGLTGGLLEAWGFSKRREAEEGWSYSLSPVVDPARRAAGFAFAGRF